MPTKPRPTNVAPEPPDFRLDLPEFDLSTLELPSDPMPPEPRRRKPRGPEYPFAAVNRAEHRLAKAMVAWDELAETLHEAAALPDYAGPDLQMVELIARGIADLREQIAEWRAATGRWEWPS